MTSLDKLTIDTPEQLALDFPLAGIGSRFLALAIDTLVQTAIAIVLVIAAVVLTVFVGSVSESGGAWIAAIWIIAYFLLQFGYFAIFESIWNGQTIGKRQMQIRVIKDDGRPITVYDAVARNLLRLVDSLPGIYGVGIVSMIFSKQNKRLGDYVAGTVVVHEKKLEGFLPATVTAAAPAASDSAPLSSPATSYGVARLSAAEVKLVETFLDRRADLNDGVRRSAARQIADRVGKTLSVPHEARRSPETFLEEVLAERRSLSTFGG